MELTTHEREWSPKRLRREGMIPAVLYGGKVNSSFAIPREELQAALRAIKKGSLATTLFTLKFGEKGIRAIVKGIQYHRTTYDVIHLDFQELVPGGTVRVNVPLTFTGVADCAGIKLGGDLRVVIRALKVSCPADRIPGEFSLDVSELNIGGTRRLNELKLPEGVVPHGKMDEVAVVIAK